MPGAAPTPLTRKLGIREGSLVLLVSPPADLAGRLAPLPFGARVVRRASAPLDVALLFVRSTADLQRRFSPLAERLDPAGGLWVCWPKRAFGVVTDLGDGVVREHGLGAGLVDNKVCAIDETWSALRFVVRLADRPR